MIAAEEAKSHPRRNGQALQSRDDTCRSHRRRRVALLAVSASPAATPVAHVGSIALDGGDARVLSGAEPAAGPVVARDGRILFVRGGDVWMINGDGGGAAAGRARRRIRGDRLVSDRRRVHDDGLGRLAVQLRLPKLRECGDPRPRRGERRDPRPPALALPGRIRVLVIPRRPQDRLDRRAGHGSQRLHRRGLERERHRASRARAHPLPELVRRSRGRRAATGSRTCNEAGSGSSVQQREAGAGDEGQEPPVVAARTAALLERRGAPAARSRHEALAPPVRRACCRRRLVSRRDAARPGPGLRDGVTTLAVVRSSDRRIVSRLTVTGEVTAVLFDPGGPARSTASH